MKVLIEKVPEGVRVELTTDAGRKPFTITLPASQVDVLVQMIQTAKRADRFRVELEVV